MHVHSLEIVEDVTSADSDTSASVSRTRTGGSDCWSRAPTFASSPRRANFSDLSPSSRHSPTTALADAGRCTMSCNRPARCP